MNQLVGLLFAATLSTVAAYEVIYAVDQATNGPRTDSNGLVYQADPNKCPYGLDVSGAKPVDLIIYNTFCYGIDNFAHEIPLGAGLKNGTYLLVLRRFEDVPVRRTTIVLNTKHTLIDRVSFFERAGNLTAYDEHAYFTVCGDRLLYRNEESQIVENKLKVQFIASGSLSNSVINSAIVLVMGDDVDKFPRLASNGDSKEAENSRLYQRYVHRCGNRPANAESTINIGLSIISNGMQIINCDGVEKSLTELD